jgi:hypothetical protein
MGGTKEAMQDLNDQYERALKQGDGKRYRTQPNANGKSTEEYTYAYKPEREQAVVEQIDRLLRSLGTEIGNGTLRADLIGCYIWISGTTKEMQEIQRKLRELKFFWNKTRQKWAWKPDDMKSRPSRADFSELAAIYGADELAQEARARTNRHKLQEKHFTYRNKR